MAWTNPLTWETEQVVSASDLNTHLRDNLKYMKGRVLAQWPAHALATSDSDSAGGPDVSSVISGAASEYLFADDADQKVYGYFAAPQDFAGDTPLVARLYWSAAATTGSVRWGNGNPGLGQRRGHDRKPRRYWRHGGRDHNEQSAHHHCHHDHQSRYCGQ